MKNILMAMLLITFCFSCSEGMGEKKKQAFDFRKARWGMSIEEVKNTENSDLIRRIDHKTKSGLKLTTGIKSEFSLEYRGSLYDLDCSIIYCFIGNKLVSAHYKIPTPYSLFVYYELKELLAMKYKSLEKEKYAFEEMGEKTYKVNRAIYENEKTALTLTAVYQDENENEKIHERKKSYVDVGYESKVHKRMLNEKMYKALNDL